MTSQITQEMPAKPEDLQRLKATLKQNIDMLDKQYQRVLNGRESDEADIVIGALGLSIKNLKMAHAILFSLAARRRDFRRVEPYTATKAELAEQQDKR